MYDILSNLPAVAVHFLLLVNVHLLINVIVKTRKFTRLSWVLTIPYAAASFIFSFLDPPKPFGLVNTIALYLILFLIIISTHSQNKFMAIYIAMIYILTDAVISPLIILILGAFQVPMDSDLLVKSISLTLNVFFLFVVIYLKKHHKNGIRYSIRLLPKKIYFLLAISLSLLGILCVFEAKQVPISVRIMSALIAATVLSSLVVMIFMLMNSISKFYFESTSQLLNKQVKLQLEHYEKIEQINQEVREFRHDYRNHMICLHTLLTNNNTKEAMEYLCSITDHTIRSMRSFRSGNSVADAILNDKCGNARAHNCDIQFSGAISDRISAFDICTILSNALDNSIEACQRLPDDGETKIISVDCSIDGCVQLIQVKNPSDASATEKTSKADKDNHGFGLYNIRRTVKALDGRVNIPSTSPEFILQIELMIPEKPAGSEPETDSREDEAKAPDLKQLQNI